METVKPFKSSVQSNESKALKYKLPVIQSDHTGDLHEDLEEAGQEVLSVDGLQIVVDEGHGVLHHLVQARHKLAGRHRRRHRPLQGSSVKSSSFTIGSRSLSVCVFYLFLRLIKCYHHLRPDVCPCLAIGWQEAPGIVQTRLRLSYFQQSCVTPATGELALKHFIS